MELSTTKTRASHLISLATANPGEAFDRVRTKIEDLFDKATSTPFQGETITWEQAVAGMISAHPDYNNGAGPGLLEEILAEPELSALERDLGARIQHLAGSGPFRLTHNADFGLARLCYVACRTFHPSIVVETGVCYGVTSSFILTALQKNGAGVLHSVDLPPLAPGGDRFVGALIPESLRDRWRLHRGPVRKILPGLLKSLRQVNMFVHDSLHTYSTMTFEFRLVASCLGPNSVVIADDVSGNTAFPAWTKTVRNAFAGIVQEKDKQSAFGLSVIL